MDCCAEHQVVRCSVCGTAFEEGVADDGRCPQCGFRETEQIDDPGETEIVIRHSTKFR